MEKFLGKYRIPSSRRQDWDYGSNAPYFVTICTNHREFYFGRVEKGIVILSEIGKIAHEIWQTIPDHHPFVKLDAFVVMPNHVHGMIIIDKPEGVVSGTPNLSVPDTTPSPPIMNPNRQQTYNASQKWKPGTLGVIVNQYKRAVTIEARKILPIFAWQSRYHEHIVYNNRAYENIRNYIINNPKKWNHGKSK